MHFSMCVSTIRLLEIDLLTFRAFISKEDFSANKHAFVFFLGHELVFIGAVRMQCLDQYI